VQTSGSGAVEPGVEVETRQGRLRGLRRQGVSVFRGIPYAAAPLGPLRFRPPAEPEAWPGVRDATRSGPAAPQIPSMLAAMLGTGADDQAEDCLTLDVFTPAADSGRRPVLVWLHGGGFTGGAGSQSIYDGSSLVGRGDVVLVNVTYRLGILGWLPLRAFAGEEGGVAGNFGLLDQVAALRWVRDNAAAFGGDPQNVTIFGESAGAMSVGALLGCPEARGLFRGAILQSGAAHNAHDPDTAAVVARAVTGALGLADDDVNGLRAAPVEAILAAQQKVLEMRIPEVRQLAFQPSVDGGVLPSPPLESIAAGNAAGVRVIAGTNLDEYKLWGLTDKRASELDEERLLRRCRVLIPGEHPQHGPHAERVVEGYRRAREGRASTEPRELWFAIESDRLFRIPALRLLEAQAPHAPAVHAYLFTWASPALGGMLGACHALDVPFVFGNVEGDPVRRFVGEGPEVTELAEAMQEAWLCFARGAAPADWPVYEHARRETWLLGGERRVESAPLEAERRVWEGVV
jgi:para-nitrobenzyl esterase